MEKLCLLIVDYTTKWRHVLSKQQFNDEFGKISEEEIIAHNLKVLENHEFLMDITHKLNELNPKKLSDEEEQLVVDILHECENFVEKDFISIF